MSRRTSSPSRGSRPHQPAPRSGSPNSETSPTPAINACPELSRCVSTTSSGSHGSSTDATSRDSLGSDYTSRHSSGSFAPRRSDAFNASRQSSYSLDGKMHRRGYMRPQGTDFAASAKSRESVMSLGSIAHLQYYFARTGLLEGKGGQLARKKQEKGMATLDLSILDSNGGSRVSVGDHDSSYASMGSSPDFSAQTSANGTLVESPIEEDEYYDDSFAESDPGMLPPTVSTYHHREKPVPKPPTIDELKQELESTLRDAQKALEEVQGRKDGTFNDSGDQENLPNMPEENTQGWYELQGMHILDVTTLAIRAAKMYYTAHEMPDMLDSIKSEKQIRADLLAVLETLKQMGMRNFKGGMKDDEVNIIRGWIDSVFGILGEEAAIAAAEQAERASWTWLSGNWDGQEYARERAFLSSMDQALDPLPEWTPLPPGEDGFEPSRFLKTMQNGVRLVQLHNAIVKRSRRRFGAIPSFHADTQKPYRCADNLRYWVKAAEIRFEVQLRIDALAVAYGQKPQAWRDFEAGILKWSKHVREEITRELTTTAAA